MLASKSRNISYNEMIDSRNHFDQPIKNVIYDNIRKIAIGHGDDYTNKDQLTSFSMMLVFTDRYLWTDFNFSLNVSVNVTFVSHMNSNSCEMKHYNFLQQWIDLIIFWTIKLESISKGSLFKQIH